MKLKEKLEAMQKRFVVAIDDLRRTDDWGIIRDYQVDLNQAISQLNAADDALDDCACDWGFIEAIREDIKFCVAGLNDLVLACDDLR